MEEKLIITEEVEERLVKIIIEFVKKEGLTTANIQEAISKVKVYMENNAVIKI